VKDIELTQNEVYFLAYQMMKLWQTNNNKHAKTIYDKAKILVDEVVGELGVEKQFSREYESEWIRSK